MRLRVQTFINNEIRISRQSDNVSPPKRSDGAEEKRNTRYAEALQQNLYSNKAIQKLYKDSNEFIREVVQKIVQPDLFGSEKILDISWRDKKILPKTFPEVSETPDGRFVVTREPTQKLLTRFGSTLDIISKSQWRVRKHSGYGVTQKPKEFSKLARHRLLEAGAAVDHLGLKDSSSLLTLTLPGSTPEAMKALSDWSGWMVNRQTQRLRNRKLFKDVKWFFVWEFQKRGALHQHWCVSAPTYEIARQASMALKSQWFICLDEIGEKENVDMYQKARGFLSWRLFPKMWQWNEQKVTKAVGAYFSKYASKQCLDSKDKRNMESRQLYFPSRWFGVCASLREVCSSYRIDFSLHGITKIEAEYLRFELIKEIEKSTSTGYYSYEFEAKSKDGKYTFCHGTTEIFYISPLEYFGRFGSISSWLGSFGSRVHPRSQFAWLLHSFRQSQVKDNVILHRNGFKYGENVVFS